MERFETLDEIFHLDSDEECDLRPIDSDDSDDEFSSDLVRRLQSYGKQQTDSKRSTQKDAIDSFQRQMNAELDASLAAHCRQMAGGLVHGTDVGVTVANSVTDAPPSDSLQNEANASSSKGQSVQMGLTSQVEKPASLTADANMSETSLKPAIQQQYYDDAYFDSDDDSSPESESGGMDAEGQPQATGTKATESTSTNGDRNASASDSVGRDVGGEDEGNTRADVDSTSKRSQRRRRRRPVLSNDELLYDPAMDDANQRWVDDQRRRYLPPAARQQAANLTAKPQKLPRSDAVLNCPACMTMLCLDCQRHELYSNQYRAMFVFNCAVDKETQLRYKSKRAGGKGRRRAADGAASADPPRPSELYNPVKCCTCQTEVAVYDNDEVFHFFNVIASHT